ncbi:4-hydroxythreonine-4-phosphate dehydrogenase PdxA [Candidatus Marinamargulisbacteria bacterium SCGC AG-414-C22]|nr:4-hydroxythreonine-4-phosphate dehydrogenase PdxA [Candidatus Marinamargulisbacteria bacterium SCGC AG-414-C22]
MISKKQIRKIQMNNKKPIIGFTFGDPEGIGPEIIFKTLRDFKQNQQFFPVIYGSKQLLNHDFIKPLVADLAIKHHFPVAGDEHENSCYFIHTCDYAIQGNKSSSAAGGQASLSYLDRAISDAKINKIDGIVTAPISKESFKYAEIPFTGHTTLLKKRTNSPSVSMGFYSPKLKVVLATIHHSLSAVPSLLTQDHIRNAIHAAVSLMQKCGVNKPRIAVAGLNPHASENGLFGNEEASIIEPVVKEHQSEGGHVYGPFPADTIFRRAIDGEFDIVIAMYHDQGLIPIKTISFYESVNVTCGLPFERTSPDHGTAFDIAYSGKASHQSLQAATNLMLKILRNRVS